MKVLVTGAAGFIGGNLMESLISKDINVIGIDSFSNYYSSDMKREHLVSFNLGSRVIETDICNAHELNELFEKFRPTHVVHLAAQGGVRASKTDPDPYLLSNQIGFLNVLNAAEKVRAEKFLYASSSSVYGDGLTAPFREDYELLAPKSLYALSKLSNEIIAKYLPQQRTQRVGFRFFTVYGPWGRPDMAVFRLLASSRLRGVFNLTASSEVIRDFTYVQDVISIIEQALSSEFKVVSSEVYNVAGGNPYTLTELFSVMHKLEIPVEIEIQDADSLDVKMTHGSILKLQASNLPIPSTSLEDGIVKTWSWMKQINNHQLRAWFEYRAH